MLYITSDIHGKFNSLDIMLKHIKFSKNDKLIINGDLMDRGEDLKPLIDFILLNKNNVEVILGNHEYMFIKACENGLLDDIDIFEIRTKHFFTGETIKVLTAYDNVIDLWFSNGGDITFRNTSIKDLKRLYNYLKDKPYYKFIDDNLIIHAGPHTYYSYGWSKDKFVKWIEQQELKDILWDRGFFEKQFLTNEEIEYPVNIFIGHNSLYNQNIEPFKIIKNGNVLVNTDQSNNLNKDMNNLGMFCLDTMTYLKLIGNVITEVDIKKYK